MKSLSFPKGGVHPKEFKTLTKDSMIEKMITPKKVVIPLHQHTGVPSRACVNVGDIVKIGDMIGQAESGTFIC